MFKKKQPEDPYIRYAKDVKPRLGCTVIDEVKLTPGPSLTRTYESGHDEKQTRFNRNPETILCPGVALGIDDAGEVHHYVPGLRFAGLLLANGEKELTAKVRGSVVLKIEGATEQDRGKSVYCSGPNTFSLESVGAEIGKVRYYQNGRCAVAFRREGDEKPLDLHVGIQR